jgi:hypothetical protein
MAVGRTLDGPDRSARYARGFGVGVGETGEPMVTRSAR